MRVDGVGGRGFRFPGGIVVAVSGAHGSRVFVETRARGHGARWSVGEGEGEGGGL